METIEDYAYGLLLSVFIDDFVFEECIDMMWCIRTGACTLDEIYNLDPIESYFAQEKTIGHQTNPSSGNNTVNCPVCSELVAGRRFAPHLEKCMNGGKRGAKRHYDYLHDDGLSKLPKAKSGDVLEHIDPLPSALIVRIKLKNGVPKPNQKRTGVSVEEFQGGEVGVTQFNQLYAGKSFMS